MEKELIENFLIKSVILNTNDDESDRLWDALWRAHRDVLTGRFYLPNYCSYSKNKTNDVVEKLYSIMKEKSSEKLTSKVLIDELCKAFEKVEFGAIQKLVNMSLKYIIILNAYVEDFNVGVNESECDCPIDSKILGKLDGKYLSWTKTNRENYENAQKEIKSKLKEENKINIGNIYFDFREW